MPSKVPRFYWDANVFLSYVDGAPGRLPHIEPLFREAEQEKIEIVTSTASIAEVAFGSVEMDERSLDEEIQKKIEELWVANSPVNLVEISVLIVEDARNIMRAAIPDHAKVAKPMDAIHVATAIRMEADVFHSYDEPLRRIARRNGLKAEEPSTTSPLLFTD